MKNYRVAILGCRSRGTAAGRAYSQHPRTEVVGVCDLLPERRDTLGEELGVPARYGDLDLMITETGPDIVVIPTGTELHFDLAMRVLEHRVHIDLEKPMCIDLEQADAVLAKAEQKGVKIAVHHQGRGPLRPEARRSRAEKGWTGDVSHVSFRVSPVSTTYSSRVSGGAPSRWSVGGNGVQLGAGRAGPRHKPSEALHSWRKLKHRGQQYGAGHVPDRQRAVEAGAIRYPDLEATPHHLRP